MSKQHDDAGCPLERLQARMKKTLDENRSEAIAKRHEKGYRTARENLADLVDEGSFVEYGQLAVAAQRSRREYTELQSATPADGILTGLASINNDRFDDKASQVAVVVNDYSVLAGTQGFFHHQKLDRLLEVASRSRLPLVMYTEGGGGRPGDTDVLVQMAGLNTTAFATWARLSGKVPRIAVNNGYCFAGNAALFGSADITIATKSSCIGMAGPAMIEGGGLGSFAPTDIGPIDVQARNGVVDIVAENEKHATQLARCVLSYFQGSADEWQCKDQAKLRDLIPEDRRWAYKIRELIEILADTDSFLEIRAEYGQGMVTGFMRLEGKPVGVIANSSIPLGGAIDAVGAEKVARFMQLCDSYKLPIVSLTDTPGFMVGPDSEKEGAVRRMSSLFVTAAALTVPVVTIVLRKGYGLGAMAMAGGSFVEPVFMAAWPSGEFGGMGLEGAVKLGYRKELERASEGAERDALFQKLVKQLYELGKATEAAAFLEIDAVIDPADTREVIMRALASAGNGRTTST
ncbi:MAG: acyl-CoA carboxylase subunit beta [Gammaproteobacteria bacterium]